MHGANHFFVGLRPGNGQHIGILLLYILRFDTKTTRDNDLTVFVYRLTDGVHRFGNSTIDESTRIHNNEISGVVIRYDFVTIGTELGQNPL